MLTFLHFPLLPLSGEGRDGGTRKAGNTSAIAPTPALPQEGREPDNALLGR